jgi:RAQPRD family integrative conjugative element protein
MRNHIFWRCSSRLLVLFMTIFISVCIRAQESEAEKRYLIAITVEIDNVKALAQKAAATANEQDRLQFDYAALLRDLQAMEMAIEQHVKEPSRSPRTTGALVTHYTKPLNNELKNE